MRVNISIGEELNNWFESESKRMGVSKSALMCMSMETYKDQKASILAMQEGARIYNLESEKVNAI